LFNIIIGHTIEGVNYFCKSKQTKFHFSFLPKLCILKKIYKIEGFVLTTFKCDGNMMTLQSLRQRRRVGNPRGAFSFGLWFQTEKFNIWFTPCLYQFGCGRIRKAWIFEAQRRARRKPARLFYVT